MAAPLTVVLNCLLLVRKLIIGVLLYSLYTKIYIQKCTPICIDLEGILEKDIVG